MIASILGDLVSDIFRKAVRTIIALTFVGICLLGAGFATGMIHPDDLRPENVRNVIATWQDRLNTMKGLTGELIKVDPTGVMQDMRDSQQDLQGRGASESPYGTSDLGDGSNATLAGNY